MQVFVNMLSGKILTLEVEGTHTVEEVHAMITATEGIPAAEQCLLLGEGEGVRLERGMTMEDYEVRMETALRLIPQRRPPPHPSRERSAEALKELLALQDGLGRRWDELHISR